MNNTFLEIYQQTGALLEGHFLLTSGRHSSQYFQCAKVLQYPNHTSVLCKEIADAFADESIETVISPAMGGIIVGQEVARQLNTRAIFTEREDKVMTLRRGFSLRKGERVLICEDVVTTGGSVFEVIKIAEEQGAEIVGIGFLVDRSNGKVDFGYKKKSVIALDVVSYEAADCPLCKSNLELVKPGSRKILQ